MEILNIQKYPVEILRKVCQPVERIADSEKKFFRQMLFTMHHFKGIGLAAPQVGVLKRIIVADVGEGPLVLANPVITQTKGTDALEEGCLSVPGLEMEIVRSYEISATGFNEKGQFIEVGVKGLMARVLQHEIDHLNGKLILDYLPFQERVKFNPETVR